jgi:hypothetical protein
MWVWNFQPETDIYIFFNFAKEEIQITAFSSEQGIMKLFFNKKSNLFPKINKIYQRNYHNITPWAHPTILSYHAASSLARFEHIFYSTHFEKRSSLLQRQRCSCTLKSRRICSSCEKPASGLSHSFASVGQFAEPGCRHRDGSAAVPGVDDGRGDLRPRVVAKVVLLHGPNIAAPCPACVG